MTLGAQVPPVAPREELVARARREKIEWYPTSSGQRRLWLLDRLQPGNPAYNMPLALRLSGPLDVGAIAGALGEIVRRHEPLRTSLVALEGEPVQVVRSARGIFLPVVDLGALPPSTVLEHARGLATTEALRPFDLASGRLLRATLLVLAPGDHVLLLTLHHVAGDEWSRHVLLRELAALYEAFACGLPSPLPALPLRYVDYAAWQHRWLASAACQEALAWWRENLAGELPVLELPTDRPRPATARFVGGRESRVIPTPVARRMRDLARRLRVTPFALQLATFKALLSRLSGQEDLLVGTPVASRTRTETEPLVGFFVNTVVLRTRLGGDPPFADLVSRVADGALSAFEHQDLPFERLVEELQPRRDLSRSPLFQVSFVLENAGSAAPGAAGEQVPTGLVLSPFGSGGETAKFDLSLFAVEQGTSTVLTVEFRQDLFDRSTAARLLQQYETFLSAAVANPDKRLSYLPVLTEAERHQISIEWNDSEMERPLPTLQERVWNWATRQPETLAVAFGDEAWTYGRLVLCARRLAGRLRAEGVGFGSVVALLSERRPETVAALLAVLQSGASYLPLDPLYPRERLAWILEDAGVSVVITYPSLSGLLDTGAFRVLCLQKEIERLEVEEGPGLDFPYPRVDPDDSAYLIYTSGSTGQPKGVVVHHRGLSNYLAWCEDAYGPGGGAPVHSSLGFDLTVTSLLGPLWAGSSTRLIPDNAGVEGLVQTLAGDGEIGLVKLTPAHLEILGEMLARGGGAARVGALVVGGEALRSETVAQWRELAPSTRVINEYGPTETVVGCAVHVSRPDDASREVVPIGRPIASMRLYIVDRFGLPVPIGVSGEIWIGGIGVARGYIGQPSQTAEKFIPDPFGWAPGARLYRTGDLARLLPSGEIDFLGRCDGQLKIRGYRIEPAEIERALARHPSVREVAVVARRGPGGAELVAFVVPAHGAEANLAVLRESVSAVLPVYMIPGEIVSVTALPLTPHGKVDRRALEAQAPQGRGQEVRQDPETELECEILQVWKDVLGERPMGVTDDFFALGGHSLLAVRVLARVRKITGKDLPLSIFFQGGTVRQLARVVEEGLRTPRSPLVVLQQGAARPPLYVVHPGGGGVMCYQPLVRHLGPEQPVFGFQADPDMPFERLADLAASYVDTLCATHPRGGFSLAGWSLGGTIAYEMALQLAERGRRPDLLVILDTLAPDLARPVEEALLERVDLSDPSAFLQALEKALHLEIPIAIEDLEAHPRERQFELVLGAARRVHAIPEDLELKDVAHALEGFRRLMRLRRNWRVRSYGGRLMLVRSRDPEDWMSAEARMLREAPALGWNRLVAGGVDVHTVPGTHFTLMIEPHVALVAERLRTCMDRLC